MHKTAMIESPEGTDSFWSCNGASEGSIRSCWSMTDKSCYSSYGPRNTWSGDERKSLQLC